MPRERWAPAPGRWQEVYAVSSLGRVMRVGAGGTLGRVLRPMLTSKGYHRVELRDRGRRQAFYLQRLVLLAFEGEPPHRGNVARHLNGDRTDNRLSNLGWGTPRDNHEDALYHGTLTRDPEGRFLGAWDGW